MFRPAPALALLALVTPMTLNGQGRPTETVKSAFAAFERRDWRQLVALVDPERLEAFKDRQLAMLVSWAQQKDSIAAAEREGRGWGISPADSLTREAIAAVETVHVPTFAGSPTLAHLAALLPAEFFVQWCAAAYGKERGSWTSDDVPDLKRSIIGEVGGTDSVTYVLYRREYRHIDMNVLYHELPGHAMVMPVRRAGAQWYLLLNDDIGKEPSFGRVIPVKTRAWPRGRSLTPHTRVTKLPSLPAGATRPARTAAAVVRAAFVAFESADWATLASVIHPERLAAFQREQIAYLIAWNDSKEARAQSQRDGFDMFMLQYDDSLPAEAVARAAETKIPAFGDAATIGELAHLTPGVFFARWCQTAYGNQGGMGKTGFRRIVVGEVMETEGVTQVLYTSDLKHTDPWHVERMGVRRTSNDWGLLLNDDIGWSIDLAFLLDPP